MLVKRKRRKGPGQEGLITASPFLMPSLIGLLVFSLLPLLISAFISLTDWNGLDQLTAPGFFQEHFIGLDNYKAIARESAGTKDKINSNTQETRKNGTTHLSMLSILILATAAPTKRLQP